MIPYFKGGKTAGKGKQLLNNPTMKGLGKIVQRTATVVRVSQHLYLDDATSLRDEDLIQKEIERVISIGTTLNFVPSTGVAYHVAIWDKERQVEMLSTLSNKISQYIDDEMNVLVTGNPVAISNLLCVVLMKESGDDMSKVKQHLQSRSSLFQANALDIAQIDMLKSMHFLVDTTNRLFRNRLLNQIVFKRQDQVNSMYTGTKEFVSYIAKLEDLSVQQRVQPQVSLFYSCRGCNAPLFDVEHMTMLTDIAPVCKHGHNIITIEPVHKFQDLFHSSPFDGFKAAFCTCCNAHIGHAFARNEKFNCTCSAHAALDIFVGIGVFKSKVKRSDENILVTLFKKFF